MKKIILSARRWEAAWLIVFFFCSAALPAGLNVTTWSGDADEAGNIYKVFDVSGDPLPVGSFVNVVKGTRSAANQANPDFLGSGTSYYHGTVGSQNTGVTAVTGVAGEFDFNFNEAIDPVAGSGFVEVWSTTAPAVGGYYNWKTFSLKGPGQSPADCLMNISTLYRAATPYKPSVVSISETTTTALPSGAKSSSIVVNSAAGTGDDGLREVTSISWNIDPPPMGTPGLSGSSISLSTSEVLPGATYTFKVNYRNTFSTEDNWSDPVTYTIGAGGGGGTTTYIFSLKKYEAGKLVVNEISSPVPIKASALAAKIDAAAGTTAVLAVCKWLPAEGKYVALLPGQEASQDFDLGAGEGVQVYVSQDVTVVVGQ